MKDKPLIPALCCVALLGACPLQAEVYKWVDDQGRVHFSDQKPQESPTETVDIDVTSYTFPTIKDNPLRERNSDGKSGAGKPEVVMYSTTWCGFCKKARRYFQANDIPFREYDVEQSARGKRDYKRMNGKGVPIILVGDKRMNGFSAERFQRMYDDA